VRPAETVGQEDGSPLPLGERGHCRGEAGLVQRLGVNGGVVGLPDSSPPGPALTDTVEVRDGILDGRDVNPTLPGVCESLSHSFSSTFVPE
jgi:hypothetical protein